jgi:hypothetical protein
VLNNIYSGCVRDSTVGENYAAAASGVFMGGIRLNTRFLQWKLEVRGAPLLEGQPSRPWSSAVWGADLLLKLVEGHLG